MNPTIDTSFESAVSDGVAGRHAGRPRRRLWLPAPALPKSRRVLLTPRAKLVKAVGAVMLISAALIGPRGLTFAGPMLAFNTGLTVSILVLAIGVMAWIGEVSMAVVSQMGFGLLAMSWLQHHDPLHLPLVVQILLVALWSIPISLLLGVFALRLRGVNFVIASLAFAQLAQKSIFTPKLGAESDQGGVARPGSLGTDMRMYYFMAASIVVMMAICYLVQRSRIGLALTAMRDSETAFWVLGHSPAAYKLGIVCLSGAIATVGGAYYGLLQGQVPAIYLSPTLALVYFGFAVAGGMGSVGGAIGAGLFFGALPKYLETYSGGTLVKYDFLFFGLVALVIIVKVPGGLAGLAARGWRRLEGRTS
jgi:branched-chain amino acid transport system permease protein